MQAETNVHQVGLPVDKDPPILALIIGELIGHIPKVTADRRTVHIQAAGDLGLSQTFGMSKQQGFDLQQTVSFVLSA